MPIANAQKPVSLMLLGSKGNQTMLQLSLWVFFHAHSQSWSSFEKGLHQTLCMVTAHQISLEICT